MGGVVLRVYVVTDIITMESAFVIYIFTVWDVLMCIMCGIVLPAKQNVLPTQKKREKKKQTRKQIDLNH